MKLFVCIYDDFRLLRHFLRHYARWGVDEFHIAAPTEAAAEIRAVCRPYVAFVYDGLNVRDSFLGGASAVSQMRAASQDENEVVLIVDLDEFVEFTSTFDTTIAKMEREGANVVRGIMFDRFAYDGQPKSFDDDSDLSSLYPIRARFIRNVMGGCDTKAVFVKGHLKSRAAHHSMEDERVAKDHLEISHYKWNDLALARVRAAYEALSEQGLFFAEEFKKILDHYENYGRFAWETFGGEYAGATRRTRPIWTRLARILRRPKPIVSSSTREAPQN